MRPIPVCPVTIPPLTEPRGNQLIDIDTGSAITNPVVYDKFDDCDQLAWKHLNSSISITQFGGNSGCDKVQAASITIKGFVPACATQTDINTLVNYVRDVINTQFPA